MPIQVYSLTSHSWVPSRVGRNPECCDVPQTCFECSLGSNKARLAPPPSSQSPTPNWLWPTRTSPTSLQPLSLVAPTYIFPHRTSLTSLSPLPVGPMTELTGPHSPSHTSPRPLSFGTPSQICPKRTPKTSLRHLPPETLPGKFPKNCYMPSHIPLTFGHLHGIFTNYHISLIPS